MKIFFLLIAYLILGNSILFAAENTVTAKSQEKAAKPNSWKSGFTSYYYDFEGTRAQKNDAYSFGDITLKMQLMSLQYQTESGLIFTALAQHYENFVVTRLGGVDYRDKSQGLGDTLFSVTKNAHMDGPLMVMTDVGLSVPTGATDVENPRFDGIRYPYNMQMGSGTYDGILGVTPLYITPSYQLGSRASAVLRGNGKNDKGYRLGDQYRLDAWFDKPMASGFTSRLVGYYRHKEGIKGQDRSFARSFLVEFYHHDQINWDVSAALKYAYSFSPALALNAEAGVPLAQESQNYDKVVVSTQYYLNLGVTGQF